MLRFFLLGGCVTALVVASCGSDDGKRSLRDSDGGESGQAGDGTAPGSGGSNMGSAGEGGQVSEGGSGGAPIASAGAPEAGATNGGAPANAGAAAGGVPAMGGDGAGGEGPAPVSPSCGSGAYDNGDGGCIPCPGAPQTVTLSCSDFYGPSLVADGGPLWIDLQYNQFPREPLASPVSVTFTSPDETLKLEAEYQSSTGSWYIDISSGPDDPTSVTVQPFSTPGACGDTYQLSEAVVFTRVAPDTYSALSCD